MKFVFLALAIISEVAGSSFLNASKQFTKVIPSIATVVSFALCFYFLSLALKHIPLGMAYAIWAELGIVLTNLVSVIIFKNSIDIPAVIGISLIITGVIIINLFSKSVSH